MKNEFTNTDTQDDRRHPHQDLEGGKSIGWVFCEDERECVAEKRNFTFTVGMCHRILCVDHEITQNHEVSDEEARVRILEEITELQHGSFVFESDTVYMAYVLYLLFSPGLNGVVAAHHRLPINCRSHVILQYFEFLYLVFEQTTFHL